MDNAANTIQVACPSCRGALTAPANYAGATVQCPRCNSQMVLPHGPSGTGPTAPPLAGKPAVAGGSRRVDDLLPPSASTSVNPAGNNAARATFRPEVAQGKPSVAAVATVATGSDAELTAKFIRRVPATAADLAPSKLPSLQLADTVEKAPRAKGVSVRGPLLAITLVFSVLSSAALLLYEPTATKTVNASDRYAWEQLETVYFGDGTALKPYQRLLRQAQQAQHRGDQKQRDILLRQVLDLLHAERSNPAFGITGYQTPSPPNDQHLEETIMTLLRQK